MAHEFIQAFGGAKTDVLIDYKKALAAAAVPTTTARTYFDLIEFEMVCKYEIAQFKLTGRPIHLRQWCLYTWALSFGCRPFSLCHIDHFDVTWVNTGFAYKGPGWQLQVMLVFKNGAGVSVYGSHPQPRNLAPRRDRPALCAVLAFIWLCAYLIREETDGHQKLFGFETVSFNSNLKASFRAAGQAGPPRHL